MKETGPDALPPFERCSFEERSLDRLTPDPEPPKGGLKEMAATGDIPS